MTKTYKRKDEQGNEEGRHGGIKHVTDVGKERRSHCAACKNSCIGERRYLVSEVSS